MERKIFWTVFTVLGLLADFLLPIWWASPPPFPASSSRGGWPTAAIGSDFRKTPKNLSGRGLRHGERALWPRRCCYYWQGPRPIANDGAVAERIIVDVHQSRNGCARKGDLVARRTRYGERKCPAYQLVGRIVIQIGQRARTS